MNIFKKIFAMMICGLAFIIWLIITAILGVLSIVTVAPVIVLIAFPEIPMCWLIIGFLILYSGGFLGEYQPEYLKIVENRNNENNESNNI